MSSPFAHLATELMHNLPVPMGTLTSWIGVLLAIFGVIVLVGIICFCRGRNAYVLGIPPDPTTLCGYGPATPGFLGFGSGVVAPVGMVNTGVIGSRYVSTGY